MNAKQLLTLGAASLITLLCRGALAQEVSVNYVQIAEIEIDPAQLESYEAAVKEHIDTAIRLEPGVLVLYAVSEKDNQGLRSVRQHGRVQGAPGSTSL